MSVFHHQTSPVGEVVVQVKAVDADVSPAHNHITYSIQVSLVLKNYFLLGAKQGSFTSAIVFLPFYVYGSLRHPKELSDKRF